jgi:hypothetical protein
MMGFIREGGFMMYFILAGAALAALSAGRAVLATRAGNSSRSMTDGVVFWGGFALIAGILGTLVGFSQMARAVERFGEVSPSMLWGGVRVALTTTIAGCMTFVLALCAWAPLRWAGSRRLPAGDRRFAVLERELQLLRGEIEQLDERTRFYETLRSKS